MSTTIRGTRSKALRATTAAALALAGLVATASASNAVATVLTLTPSSATGPTAGGNTLVLTLGATASTPVTNKFVSGALSLQLQNVAAGNASPTCAASGVMTGTITANNFFVNPAAGGARFISTTRATLVIPSSIQTAQNSITPTNNWLICAYNGSSEPIGKGTYTTVAAPTVSTVNTYSQASGPGSAALSNSNPAVKGASSGGTSIAVVGTNFPASVAGLTVLLGATVTGGTTSSGITTGGTVTGGSVVPVTANSLSATGFTGTLPAKVGVDLPLTITTAGGSVTFLHAFSSINGITISPNSVVQGSAVDIDVQGAGFTGSAFAFTNTGTAGAGAVSGQDDATSHVFLVNGVYDPTGYTDATAGPGTVKANGQVAECVDVFVISDAELICTLNSAKKAVFNPSAVSGSGWTYPSTQIPLGAYTVTVVDTANTASVATNRTAVSAGSTFTVGQF